MRKLIPSKPFWKLFWSGRLTFEEKNLILDLEGNLEEALKKGTCPDCGGFLSEPGAPAICATAHVPGARQWAFDFKDKLDALQHRFDKLMESHFAQSEARVEAENGGQQNRPGAPEPVRTTMPPDPPASTAYSDGMNERDQLKVLVGELKRVQSERDEATARADFWKRGYQDAFEKLERAEGRPRAPRTPMEAALQLPPEPGKTAYDDGMNQREQLIELILENQRLRKAAVFSCGYCGAETQKIDKDPGEPEHEEIVKG